MNEIARIRPNFYISTLPKEGGRWTPRASYQLGRRSLAPFDLTPMKKAHPAKSRFSFIEGVKNILFFEESFTLPSLEEYLTAFPHPPKPLHAFAPTFPFPDASMSPSQNLVFTGLPEEINKVPLGRVAFSLTKCLKATLHKNQDGSYYLKLPDSLVRNLQAFFQEEGALLPSHFQLMEEGVPIGAHIPTILKEESLSQKEILKETGEEFYFALLGVYQHKVRAFPGIDTVWYLSFQSYDLEALRQKYGLLRKIKGFDFTCLIATKPTTALPAPSFFTVNPSNFSA